MLLPTTRYGSVALTRWAENAGQFRPPGSLGADCLEVGEWSGQVGERIRHTFVDDAPVPGVDSEPEGCRVCRKRFQCRGWPSGGRRGGLRARARVGRGSGQLPG